MSRDFAAVAANDGVEPFDLVDLGEWEGVDPSPKEFVMPGFVPARELTLATGAGGANKSTFGQQLATCVASGRPMLGIDVARSKALYITAEDDDDRLHWMQEHICKAIGVRLPDLGGKLYLASLRGRLGNELATFDSVGKIMPSDSYGKLRATLAATAAKLLVLDNAAHLFVGNENDRQQVTAFVNLLYSLTLDFGVSIILVAHANKAGDSYSGSTAWLNAVRSQIVLSRTDSGDPDERTLTLGKANYARQGDALRFRWHDFALRLDEELPDDKRAEFAAIAQAASDNAIFLDCLRERTRQRRAVSERHSATFAPTVFATMGEAKRIGKQRLEAAMDRLFATGQIERAELWKGDDRKLVYGLRETAGNGAGDGAANTVRERGERLSGDVLDTHSPLKGGVGAAFQGLAPTPEGELAA